MNRRAAVALLALIAGLAMISNTGYLKRKQERAILTDRESSYVAEVDQRVVDLGVTLRVVASDPAGETLLRGKPKLRVIREHQLGGMIDVRERKRLGTSQDPLIWYASEAQEEILFGEGPPARLVEGSEGAGKTTVLAQWHYVQWLSHLFEEREGLQTAPTNLRLGLVRREIRKLWRPEWYRYVARKEFVGYELCDGSAIRMVSTHRQSEAQGSPVQGFNSSWAGRDEAQDQLEVHEDIESRGREARDGIYPQLATATMKDSSDYRAFRDKIIEGGEWSLARLLICEEAIAGDLDSVRMLSPFVTRAFLESKRKTMDEREFRRRYLAQDQLPELAVYYGWNRARNLVRRPQISTDVTAAVLDGYKSYSRPGARFTLLCGHDPGVIYNTTVVFKLVMFGIVPTWMAVGELQTKQTSAREHALKLRQYLAATFGVERTLKDRFGRDVPDPESSKALVFVDPHGKGETQTDYQAVYMAFQHEGLDVFSPAGTHARIKRSARIQMINRLFCDARGVVRLVVAGDDRLQPAAPELVKAFETLKKREGDDNAEGVFKKDEKDRTHAPAAGAYALWSFEQEAFTGNTVRLALAAARKVGV